MTVPVIELAWKSGDSDTLYSDFLEQMRRCHDAVWILRQPIAEFQTSERCSERFDRVPHRVVEDWRRRYNDERPKKARATGNENGDAAVGELNGHVLGPGETAAA
jgi:exonuclease V gamma subunit